MTDLFRINWTAIYEPLKGLPKDGVKGLIDIEVQHTIGKRKRYTVLEPFNGIHSLFLDEVRSHRHRLAQSLYIRVTIKDLHRKRDVQDSLTREDVLLDGLHDELYDIVLGSCLHIVT